MHKWTNIPSVFPYIGYLFWSVYWFARPSFCLDITRFKVEVQNSLRDVEFVLSQHGINNGLPLVGGEEWFC